MNGVDEKGNGWFGNGSLWPGNGLLNGLIEQNLVWEQNDSSQE